MSAFSNEMEGYIVAHFLQGTAQAVLGGDASSSTKLYLGLFEGVGPGETGYSNETNYGASGQTYLRQHITFGNIDANGNTSNGDIITFPANPDATSVTIRHAAVYTTPGRNTGVQVLHGELVAAKTLDQNDVLSFGVGALVLNIN